MRWDEYGHLLTERGTLRRLLQDIPEEDVLDRSSFLSRLAQVERQIDAATPVLEPARARLTFRGPPVIGGHGVFADFGMRATSDFVEAVTALAASQISPLGSSGPIPNRDQYRLLITGTAVGSFGFELEEHQTSADVQPSLGLPTETALAQALTQTQDLLRSSLGSDDDVLADAVAGVDPRARTAVRTFLDTLATHDATFALDIGTASVSPRDVADVRRAVIRLAQENLREERETFEGVLQGVLPKRRTFEFRLAERNDILSGKVGLGIAEPAQLNDHLHRPARISVTTVRVGTGRPRYVLNEFPEWLAATQAGNRGGHRQA